jgi:hypothetical protein
MALSAENVGSILNGNVHATDFEVGSGNCEVPQQRVHWDDSS